MIHLSDADGASLLLKPFQNFLIFLNDLQQLPLAVGLVEGLLLVFAQILIEMGIGGLAAWMGESCTFGLYRLDFFHQ
jgi:hypothetical protein